MNRRNILHRLENYVKDISWKLSRINFNRILRGIDYKKVFYIFIFFIIIVGIYFVYTFFGAKVEMDMVSGTEYISGETGQVIVRLSDRYGNAVSGATCEATVLYPDKTYFLIDKTMVESSELGNYYYEFTSPSVTGIYEYTIKCEYNQNNREQTSTVSHSFHVSPALNYVYTMSQVQAERHMKLMEELNETREELKTTKAELIAYMSEVNKSVNGSISNEMNSNFDSFYGRMDNLGAAMSDIFNKSN